MANFEYADADNVLGIGRTSLELDLSRALMLLAVATAPAPDSRYQPGASWTAIKYGTAIDPRLSVHHRQRRAAANPGIFDLDPHQKTILADDLGVALALACIDVHHGIIGLADCYALWLRDSLGLMNDGRHRRMPDFAVLLEVPLQGSHVILLECKGSTRRFAAAEQLVSGCNQLRNVERLDGVRPNGAVPRVAIAVTVHPGAPVALSVADPPEEVEVSEQLKRDLRANYLALELAAFGDLGSAERVRTNAGLPTWSRFQVPKDLLPSGQPLQLTQYTFSALPRFKRLPKFAKEALDPTLARKDCLARSELRAWPSEAALAAQGGADQIAFKRSSSSDLQRGQTTEEMISDRDGGVVVRSADQARSGIRTELDVEVWSSSR